MGATRRVRAKASALFPCAGVLCAILLGANEPGRRAEAAPQPAAGRASAPSTQALAAPAVDLDLKAEWQAQYRTLAGQIADRGWFDRVAAQAYDAQALILKEDRDPLDVVLRRAEALLADVRRLGPKADLASAEAALREARQESARHAPQPPAAAPAPKGGGKGGHHAAKPAPAAAAPEGPRVELYLKVCALRRRIAFANPLLDFDRIFFVQRHLSANHMCDQFYGHLAKPGGGLFVLSDPFGPRPALQNLLSGSVVESGRLKGRTLAPGAFLSPELSFDAKTILVAHTELKGRGWSPESAWHIFRARADGTGLAQLTDGAWNDFDPCVLPDGRVAFVSERRGGYLRCSPGRPCPVYTLFSMAPDGGDIANLSFHETHEWQPSVDNDGKIIYTRWDYVDRDTNAAHHVWSCFPDGREPRSLHGNYPIRREVRPWFEADARAIPARAQKYVATAAGHHWQAFGSLVHIDQNREDDGAMSQVRRITPEAPFPEGEKYNAQFATPWPISETYYLCAHDAEGKNHGLYLVDAFGNKDLLYRDPSIPSMSPIPFRPRAMPPVIPRQVQTAAESARAPRPATIAVMNVYDADFDWPPAGRIAGLRIIQILPKTNAPRGSPRIGVAADANARAVLGTVPVESDGSVYFEAPPGKPIYFQALDERGLAIQSMRSATYVHPGEKMTCRGCHERKHSAPANPNSPPLALRRSPSTIAPEAQGSNPFNYVVLVQPVLDRHCVACHQEKNALDLSGAPGGKGSKNEGPFTRSYENLAAKYGFYFDSSKGCYGNAGHGGGRTTAGQFGARASKLLQALDKGHHGVKLPPEDLRRITLWLDCNSDFLGAYHDVALQVKGQPVKPALE
jgi:hypothetical protein